MQEYIWKLLKQNNYVLDLVNNLLKGLAEQRGENWDNVFAEDIVNHLFEQQDPDTGKQRPGTGLDLIAINIQRGRDHGIPGYNEMREICGIGKATKFSDFSKEMLPGKWNHKPYWKWGVSLDN